MFVTLEWKVECIFVCMRVTTTYLALMESLIMRSQRRRRKCQFAITTWNFPTLLEHLMATQTATRHRQSYESIISYSNGCTPPTPPLPLPRCRHSTVIIDDWLLIGCRRGGIHVSHAANGHRVSRKKKIQLNKPQNARNNISQGGGKLITL